MLPRNGVAGFPMRDVTRRPRDNSLRSNRSRSTDPPSHATHRQPHRAIGTARLRHCGWLRRSAATLRAIGTARLRHCGWLRRLGGASRVMGDCAMRRRHDARAIGAIRIVPRSVVPAKAGTQWRGFETGFRNDRSQGRGGRQSRIPAQAGTQVRRFKTRSRSGPGLSATCPSAASCRAAADVPRIGDPATPSRGSRKGTGLAWPLSLAGERKEVAPQADLRR